MEKNINYMAPASEVLEIEVERACMSNESQKDGGEKGWGDLD